MTAQYQYYLAAGTLTKAVLIAAPANNVENFTVQSDQTTPVFGWHEPQRDNTMRPRLARYVTYLDQSVRGDGAWSFQWSWKVFTHGQLNFMNTTFFSSGAIWSAPCTVQTYADGALYAAYNATIVRPVPGQDYTLQDDTLIDVIYKFVGGIVI